MNQQVNGIFSEEQNTVSIKEKVSKYLRYWPLFLICLLLSVGAGILYTYYAIPKYMATTTFLVKGAAQGEASSADLIEIALNGKSEINLSNELVQMRSVGLMKRTVARNNFNVSYYRKGRIHSIEIYQDAPFTLIAQQLTDSNSTYNLHISQVNAQGGTFLYGDEGNEKAAPIQIR